MSGNKARHHVTKTFSYKVSYCAEYGEQNPWIRMVAVFRSPYSVFCFLSFAGLVVLAGEFYPIPFRTRPSKLPAPMVLRLKPRESRSLPVLPRTASWNPANTFKEPRGQKCSRGFLFNPCRLPNRSALCYMYLHTVARRATVAGEGR